MLYGIKINLFLQQFYLISYLEIKKKRKVTELFPLNNSTELSQPSLTSVFEMGTGVTKGCLNLLILNNDIVFIKFLIGILNVIILLYCFT